MSLFTKNMVAIDTNILIYAAAPIKDAEDETLHLRAKMLLQKITEAGQTIALPVPVVAEFLSGLDADTRSVAYKTLLQEFVILPFDDKSARVYAHVMAHRHHDGVWEQSKSSGVPRRCLLADIAILSVAEAHGLPWLYTGERKRFIPRLAENARLKIVVRSIYDEPFQYPLPLTE